MYTIPPTVTTVTIALSQQFNNGSKYNVTVKISVYTLGPHALVTNRLIRIL